jgi:CheY-like chemotaxis protein
MTVLIVDDEPTVRTLVAEVLEDLGYTVIEASDATGGLRVVHPMYGSTCSLPMSVCPVCPVA